VTPLLILCEYPSLNGGERSLLAVLPEIAAAGYDISVACPGRGPLRETLAQCGFATIPLETHVGEGSRLSQPRSREKIADVIRVHRPALVHANSLSMSRLLGPVAVDLDLPAVGHLRDILRLSRRAVADLNCLPKLIAVSAATRDYHVRQGLESDRVVVVHNGVDLQQFAPRSATGYLHWELDLPPDTTLIGAIGQLGMRKGLDVLLESARTVAAQQKRAHWLLIGERHSRKSEAVEYERRLHEAAERPPLLARVHFLGRRDDVPRILGELTLLVHAARQEPFGRVLLEAAACGVPMIATDVGGTREIYPPRTDSALLVPPDDPAALSEATLRALGDAALCRQLAAAARKVVTERFDHRAAAANLIHVYHRVLTADS